MMGTQLTSSYFWTAFYIHYSNLIQVMLWFCLYFLVLQGLWLVWSLYSTAVLNSLHFPVPHHLHPWGPVQFCCVSVTRTFQMQFSSICRMWMKCWVFCLTLMHPSKCYSLCQWDCSLRGHYLIFCGIWMLPLLKGICIWLFKEREKKSSTAFSCEIELVFLTFNFMTSYSFHCHCIPLLFITFHFGERPTSASFNGSIFLENHQLVPISRIHTYIGIEFSLWWNLWVLILNLKHEMCMCAWDGHVHACICSLVGFYLLKVFTECLYSDFSPANFLSMASAVNELMKWSESLLSNTDFL